MLIEEFSISGKILIALLIAVAQPLHAIVNHNNVQKTLENGQSQSLKPTD